MDKKLIKEDISNMKFLMGYKAGKVISEQENQGSKRKALSLSEFWQLQIDSHFQHVLDNVLKEPFDENNLEKYFDKMVEYIFVGSEKAYEFSEADFDQLKSRCQQAADHNRQLLKKMRQAWPSDFAAWLPAVLEKIQ